MSAIPRGLAATAQKRSLVEEIKESLRVTETVAHAALPGGREPDSPTQPCDHDENEEAPA